MATPPDESRTRKKLLLGIILYAVLFFAILLISRNQSIQQWFSVLLNVLRPILIGLVIAYIANPFFRLFERRLLVRIKRPYLRRSLSLILTYLLLLLVVALLVVLIVPQLYASIQNFVANFHENLSGLIKPVNGVIEKLNSIFPPNENGVPAFRPIEEEDIAASVSSVWNYFVTYFQTEIGFSSIPRVVDLLSRTASGLTNLIFGIFASIYLLSSKERRHAQILKLRRALFSEKVDRHITHICTVADRSFGGFLRGKVIDSLIVGILVYFTCLILRIPYPLLVATIVGITDIVPVIGPFIGVVPTAIIILLTDPIKVIFFLIAILVIQQIDGNIIAPKILGENTGVSSLCVMIAIILMGSLWGLVGMLIGVPLFATVLELLDVFLEDRLKKRGLPNDLDSYYSENALMIGRTPRVPSLAERKRRKREERYNRLSRNAGSGDLTLIERIELRTYRLAEKYHLYSDFSEETLARFAEEENAAMQENARKNAETAETPASDEPAAAENAEPLPDAISGTTPAEASAPASDAERTGGDAE